jgi:hypothetical protein
VFITFTFLLTAIRRLKKELVFYCCMLNDIFDCDDVDNVMSRWKKKVLFHWVEYRFLFH